jgi:anti-anti-sigma regulatory factor
VEGGSVSVTASLHADQGRSAIVTAGDDVLGLEHPALSVGERAALAEFWGVYEAHFDAVADAVDADALDHPEVAGFVGATGSAQRLAGREFIRQAIEDDDWHPYLVSIHQTGTRYAEAGLTFGAWFGAGRAMRMRITPLVVDAFRSEPLRLAEALRGAAIFVDLAMVTIGSAYLTAKERIIRAQQETIRELSTPVLELHPGLLLLPLIGLIDTERAAGLTEQLLTAISTRRGRVVILDVTGVPAVDSAVATHLMHSAQAARLMGAIGIVAGLSAANAQTLVGLGVDFSSLHVVGTLADAIEDATTILRPDPTPAAT